MTFFWMHINGNSILTSINNQFNLWQLTFLISRKRKKNFAMTMYQVLIFEVEFFHTASNAYF